MDFDWSLFLCQPLERSTRVACRLNADYVPDLRFPRLPVAGSAESIEAGPNRTPVQHQPSWFLRHFRSRPRRRSGSAALADAAEQIPLTASVATIIVERFLDTLMLICFVRTGAHCRGTAAEAQTAPLALMKSAAWMMVGASIAAIIFLFIFRSNDRSDCSATFRLQIAGFGSEELLGRLVVPSQRLKSRTGVLIHSIVALDRRSLFSSGSCCSE